MIRTRFPLLITGTILLLLPSLGAAANRRQTVEQLTEESDRVVLGTVVSQTSRWTDNGRIHTDFVIATDLAIKGDEDSALVVEVPGGVVGDTEMTVSDAPELTTGEQVLLFLRRNQERFEVVGRDHGKYGLRKDSEAAAAIEGAFQAVEKRTGKKLSYKRGLAVGYLAGRDTLGESKATATATTAAVSACFVQNGARWPTNSATFKIGPSVPASWAPSLVASTVTWNNAGTFVFVNDSSSANELSYLDLVAKYGSSYANTYAVTTTWTNTSTTRIVKATIEINSAFQWSTTAEANKADVQNIMTHEFGHWLRLGDLYQPAECSEVTMWGTAAFGETKKRTLEQADIDGLASLYGAATSLSAPTLASPGNGASGVATSASLTWNAASGATGYDVYLGTSSSPVSVGSTTSTTYQAASLSPGTTYYWRVVAKNSSTSASSQTWAFTTAPATPAPSAGPTLISPANGATGVTLTPIMSWSAVSGATTYDLYIGTTPTPPRIGTVGATSVTVSGFQSGTLYYWRVVARTAAGSVSSGTASFQTR